MSLTDEITDIDSAPSEPTLNTLSNFPIAALRRWICSVNGAGVVSSFKSCV